MTMKRSSSNDALNTPNLNKLVQRMTTSPERTETMTSTENQVRDNPEVVNNEEVSSNNNIDPDAKSSSQSALQLITIKRSSSNDDLNTQNVNKRFQRITTSPERTMTGTENQVRDNPEVVNNEEVSSSDNIDPDTQSSSQSALQLITMRRSLSNDDLNTQNLNKRFQTMTTSPERTMTGTENEVRDNPEVVNNEEVSSSNNIDPGTQLSSQFDIRRTRFGEVTQENVGLLFERENIGLLFEQPPQNIHGLEVYNSIGDRNLNVFLNGRPHRVMGLAIYDPLGQAPIMPPLFKTFDRKHTGKYKELTTCGICYEDKVGNSILNPCKHDDFCDTCLRKLGSWRCPICRAIIKEICVYV